MTKSSLCAARPGTTSSNSLGASCPSETAIGPIHDAQRKLVLYIRLLRQVISSIFEDNSIRFFFALLAVVLFDVLGSPSVSIRVFER
jgi:hypothetical protein